MKKRRTILLLIIIGVLVVAGISAHHLFMKKKEPPLEKCYLNYSAPPDGLGSVDLSGSFGDFYTDNKETQRIIIAFLNSIELTPKDLPSELYKSLEMNISFYDNSGKPIEGIEIYAANYLVYNDRLGEQKMYVIDQVSFDILVQFMGHISEPRTFLY